mmetsp:Transcript_4611/g.10832  ORF Transcript_4611/g.10832 Transcript_4611/m.10832 type:complete len:206 (-) Transcript_4611:847-1464(-)
MHNQAPGEAMEVSSKLLFQLEQAFRIYRGYQPSEATEELLDVHQAILVAIQPFEQFTEVLSIDGGFLHYRLHDVCAHEHIVELILGNLSRSISVCTPEEVHQYRFKLGHVGAAGIMLLCAVICFRSQALLCRHHLLTHNARHHRQQAPVRKNVEHDRHHPTARRHNEERRKSKQTPASDGFEERKHARHNSIEHDAYFLRLRAFI